MASDDIVWNIIGGGFCSFKITTSKDQTFCREPHNVTGFCSKQACPLANSRYATIRAQPDGTLYLYIKDVERAHLPSKWWSRIKLSSQYHRALEQIDHHLAYWPKFMIHRNKQRLTRLTQIGLRIKRLAKEEDRLGERLVPRLAPKVRRREEGRERKAQSAAKVERAIERVLLDRLRSGAYGDQPLNVDPGIWDKVMNGLEREGLATLDEDLDDGVPDDKDADGNEVEYEMEPTKPFGEVEYVADVESDLEDLSDFEEWLGAGSDDDEAQEESEDDEATSGSTDEEGASRHDAEARKLALQSLKRKREENVAQPRAKRKPRASDKGPRVEIEYEMERELPAREAVRI